MSGALGDDAPAPMISSPLLDASNEAPAQTTLDESLAATAASGWRNATELWRNPAALNAEAAPPGNPGDLDEATQSLGLEGPTYGAPAAPLKRMPADAANAANKAAGGTLTPFTHDTTNEAFNGMLADNLANNKDADVIARSAAGIIASPARVATGMLVSLSDPRNIAAMMIPGVGEARVIEALGGGVAARIGGRAALGGVQNAAVGVGLAPLQAAQADTDHTDFSWGETLRNAMFMAAFGAGGGALHGVLGRVEPETTEATMRAAVARVLTDHPQGVDIQGILDHADATQAADNLGRFQQQQAAIDAARPGEAAPDTTVFDRGQAIAAHEERLGSMREQAATYFREAEAERANRVGADFQDQHFGRLDAINARLDQGIPQVERDRLETEKAQIQAGGTDATNLERQRSIAQEAGLRSAAANAVANIRGMEGFIERLRSGDMDAQEQAEANRQSSDRATRIQQLKLDSREDVLQALMEKEVRRYAYKIGVPLRVGEAETAAHEIRTASPDEVQDTIAAHLNALGKDSPKPAVRDALAAQASNPTAGLRREAQGAAADMATRAQNVTDPELVQAQRANAATIAQAPKVEGEVSKDTAEATQMAADRKAEYDGMVQAGAIVEHPTLAEAGKVEAEYGKAAEAYAKACAFGG